MKKKPIQSLTVNLYATDKPGMFQFDIRFSPSLAFKMASQEDFKKLLPKQQKVVELAQVLMEYMDGKRQF